jgi:hypothetical protein
VEEIVSRIVGRRAAVPGAYTVSKKVFGVPGGALSTIGDPIETTSKVEAVSLRRDTGCKKFGISRISTLEEMSYVSRRARHVFLLEWMWSTL